MERIKAAIEQAKSWDTTNLDKELGLAIRIAFNCTDHAKNRYELLAEAAFDKIAQDLGNDIAREIFEAVSHG